MVTFLIPFQHVNLLLRNLTTQYNTTDLLLHRFSPPPLNAPMQFGTTTKQESSDSCNAPEPNQVHTSVDFVIRMIFMHPFKILVTSFIISMVCSVFSLRFMNLANPRAGLRLRDHITAERSDAWLMAMLDLSEQNKNIPRRHSERTQLYSPLELTYAAKYWRSTDKASTETVPSSDNVLTVENIKRIAKFEDSILLDKEYKKYCLLEKGKSTCAPVRSVIPYLRDAKTQGMLYAHVVITF